MKYCFFNENLTISNVFFSILKQLLMFGALNAFMLYLWNKKWDIWCVCPLGEGFSGTICVLYYYISYNYLVLCVKYWHDMF